MRFSMCVCITSQSNMLCLLKTTGNPYFWYILPSSISMDIFSIFLCKVSQWMKWVWCKAPRSHLVCVCVWLEVLLFLEIQHMAIITRFWNDDDGEGKKPYERWKWFLRRTLSHSEWIKKEKENTHTPWKKRKRQAKQNRFFITFWCFDSFSNTFSACDLHSLVVFILKLYYKFDDLW